MTLLLLLSGKYKVSNNCAFTWPKGQHGLCGDPVGEWLQQWWWWWWWWCHKTTQQEGLEEGFCA